MRIADELWSTTKPVFVHELMEHEIEAMRHIEPLLNIPDTCAYQRIRGIQSVDPRGETYLWDAEPYGERLCFGPLNSITIMSFHRFGAPALFKPSLAEVYGSIHRFVPDWSRVRFFSLRADNMGPEHILGDCHWCFCDLFGEPSHA